MGERTGYEPGTFCWVDLGTTDQAGAKRFYGELFGWEYEDRPVGGGAHYAMASIGGRTVAAIAPTPRGEEQSHWNCYVAVESADATAGRAGELGAEVAAAPFDVFAAGRMAVVRDPQGAGIMLWEAREMIGASLVNAPGALSWNDLLTSDPAAAREFYAGLFGWKYEPIKGMERPYAIVHNEGRPNGGITQSPPDRPPLWIAYFGSEDAHATVDEAVALGGTRMVPVADVGFGRIALLADPAGAVFAIYEGDFDD